MRAVTLVGLSIVVGLVIQSGHGQGSETSFFRDLTVLGAELASEKEAFPGFFMIRTHAEGAMEAMKVPQEFRDLNVRLDRHLNVGAFADAADTADQMEVLMPRVHSLEYPLNHDFLVRWRAEIGDLRAFACDYEGAAREYEKALKMTSIRAEEALMQHEAGKQHAAYGLARVYGLLGRHKEAERHLKEAPTYYWSGCGNCEEGEREQVHRYTTVWTAASLPYAEAKSALTKILHGDYRPLPMRHLIGGGEGDVLNAKVEAAFSLGELSLRQGDTKLAKACYSAVSKRRGADIGRMAATRLSEL